MAANALQALLEIAAIEQLKYRYARALDGQDWALMARCLAEDVRVWLADGRYTFEGRQTYLDWIAEVMAVTYSSHIVLHPEIELTGPAAATGVWRFQDVDYFTGGNASVKEGDIQGGEKLEGAGYYHDEYVKIGGDWLIQSTGTIRLFEAVWRPKFGRDDTLSVEPLRGRRPDGSW